VINNVTITEKIEVPISPDAKYAMKIELE